MTYHWEGLNFSKRSTDSHPQYSVFKRSGYFWNLDNITVWKISQSKYYIAVFNQTDKQKA